MNRLGPITLLGKDYVMWKNSEGFIELYRTLGVTRRENNAVYGSKVERFVTNVKNPKDLAGWFKKKKRKPSYDPYKDDNQMEIK